MICPKCRHTRTHQDDAAAPDYQCPACGIVYDKYNRPPLAQAKAARSGFNPKAVTIPQAVIISVAIIALGTWLALRTQTSATPAGMDRPPELSISEITAHPEKLTQYKKDFCAWSQREQAREPGIYNKARAESACKN